MKPYYVILTGSKNNAGDYLIKHRAKQLFKQLRPDRDVVDYNAWIPFDEERLEVVNKAEALILMGGPALQYNTRPFAYPMVSDLSKIKVPIVMMGVGWYSPKGNWDDSHNYPLNEETLELLNRIAKSDLKSSVRDYHTLNVLLNNSMKNVVMTGCPALYDFDYIGKDAVIPSEINKIVFSLGVGFVYSKRMFETMKASILALKDHFSGKSFVVAFHHSIDKDKYLKTHDAKPKFLEKHLEFAKWLKSQNIEYVDISGSADHLIELYTSADLHIGYRVHAHIFSSSISHPSILIAEDGRGKALKMVLNGMIFDAYRAYSNKFIDRVKRKLLGIDRYVPNAYLAKDLTQNIDYEVGNGFPRLLGSRTSIDALFPRMEGFMKQLP